MFQFRNNGFFHVYQEDYPRNPFPGLPPLAGVILSVHDYGPKKIKISEELLAASRSADRFIVARRLDRAGLDETEMPIVDKVFGKILFDPGKFIVIQTRISGRVAQWVDFARTHCKNNCRIDAVAVHTWIEKVAA